MCARDVHQARKARPQRRHGRLLRLFLLLDDVDGVARLGLRDDDLLRRVVAIVRIASIVVKRVREGPPGCRRTNAPRWGGHRGGGPREVACRVGDDDKAAAAAPAPPRRIGAPAPRRSLADALDDDGADSDDSDDDAAEEIVVAEPLRRDVVVDVVEPEEEAEEASVAALRARLAVMVDVARAHGLTS